MLQIISKWTLRLLVSLKITACLFSPLMKINPQHFKGVFDHSPHFLTSREMSGRVKSVVLSWQASIRTWEEGKGFQPFLAKLEFMVDLEKYLSFPLPLQLCNHFVWWERWTQNTILVEEELCREKSAPSFSTDYCKSSISGLCLFHCMIEHI